MNLGPFVHDGSNRHASYINGGGHSVNFERKLYKGEATNMCL